MSDAGPCGATCLKDLKKPYNIPPSCKLNDCLQCDEDHAGPVFKRFAARTRRRSGLISAIQRSVKHCCHHPTDVFWVYYGRHWWGAPFLHCSTVTNGGGDLIGVYRRVGCKLSTAFIADVRNSGDVIITRIRPCDSVARLTHIPCGSSRSSSSNGGHSSDDHGVAAVKADSRGGDA